MTYILKGHYHILRLYMLMLSLKIFWHSFTILNTIRLDTLNLNTNIILCSKMCT